MEKVLTDSFRLVGTVLERKFRIDRLVAEGGFGVVYHGTHLSLERPIGIKVLKVPHELNLEARNAFIENFTREARTIARLSHPHIVNVLDTGVSTIRPGVRAPWMVMEWLEGHTLAHELQTRSYTGRRRTPKEALELMRPILQALAFAHDEGVAHRDVKPSNVMLVRTRYDITPKLLDFGIAKVMESGETTGSGQTHTASALIAFSARYATPEQIGRTRTGPWTDVYALGLIFTELLTGQRAYDGTDNTVLFAEALSPVRPTPAKHQVDVGDWEQVLARAVVLKPAERFQSAGLLLKALEEALPQATAREPVPATAPATPEAANVLALPTSPFLQPVPSALIDDATTTTGAYASIPPRRTAGGRWWAILGLVAALSLIVGSVVLASRWRRPSLPARSASAPAATLGAPSQPSLPTPATHVVPIPPPAGPAPVAATPAQAVPPDASVTPRQPARVAPAGISPRGPRIRPAAPTSSPLGIPVE